MPKYYKVSLDLTGILHYEQAKEKIEQQLQSVRLDQCTVLEEASYHRFISKMNDRVCTVKGGDQVIFTVNDEGRISQYGSAFYGVYDCELKCNQPTLTAQYFKVSPNSLWRNGPANFNYESAAEFGEGSDIGRTVIDGPDFSL